MSAYLVADIDLKDPVAYQTYLREAPTVIAKHGGEYLVRGGGFEIVEGEWRPHRLVLLRFPDMKSIRALFADPEYQPLKAIRHECANSSMVAMEGVG